VPLPNGQPQSDRREAQPQSAQHVKLTGNVVAFKGTETAA
jgi:hypothetical protein